jgi:hypothetical protein
MGSIGCEITGLYARHHLIGTPAGKCLDFTVLVNGLECIWDLEVVNKQNLVMPSLRL